MYSPAFALAGPVLATAKSALRLTVVLTLELSLEPVGSAGDWLPTEAVLVSVPAAVLDLIWAWMRTIFEFPTLIAPSASVPPQLEPVLGLQGLVASTQ